MIFCCDIKQIKLRIYDNSIVLENETRKWTFVFIFDYLFFVICPVILARFVLITLSSYTVIMSDVLARNIHTTMKAVASALKADGEDKHVVSPPPISDITAIESGTFDGLVIQVPDDEADVINNMYGP